MPSDGIPSFMESYPRNGNPPGSRLSAFWPIRNDCQHGKDAVTKQQHALKEQTAQELHCIYLLRAQVLPSQPQDRQLFRNSIDAHLSESIPQQRSWLKHNKKLIVHSVKVAAAQAKLHTHQIKRFFEHHKTLQSKTACAINPQVSKRRQIATRISNHFNPCNTSASHLRTPVCKIPPKPRTSNMADY